MHELGLATSILEIASATAKDQPAGIPWRVGRIRVRVGDLAGVDPESLGFCFEVVRGEWVETAGAALDIQRCPSRVQCATCGVVSDLSLDGTGCGSCGSLETSLVSGRELEVFGIELISDESEKHEEGGN